MRALFVALCVLAVVTSAQQIRQQRGQVADQDQVLLQDENLEDQQQGITTEQPAVIEQQQQPGVIRQQQPIVQQRQQQQPVIQQQQPVIQQQPVQRGQQQRGQRGQQQQQQRRQQQPQMMQDEEDTVIIPIPTDLVNKWTTMLLEAIKIEDPITVSSVIDNSTEFRYDTLLPFGGSYFGVEGFWEYFLKCIMTRKITDLNYDILGSDTSRGTSLVRLTWSADFLDTSESSGEWTGMNQQRQGRQQQQQQGFQQQQQLQQPLVQQQQPIVEQQGFQQQQPVIQQNQPIQRTGRGLLQQRGQQQGVFGQQRQQRGQQRVGQQQQQQKRSIQDQESMCVLKWNIASGNLKHIHCFDMEQQQLLNSFFKRGERLGFSFLDRFFRSGILTEDSPVFDLVSQDALLNINMLPIGGLQQTSFSGAEEWLNFFQLLDKQMSATCNPQEELEFANQPSAFEQQQQGGQQQSRQQQQGGVRQQSQQQRGQGRQLLQQRRGQQQQQTPVVQQQQPVVQQQQPVVQQQQPLAQQQNLGMQQQMGQQSDVIELLQRPEAQAICHVALRALNKLMMAESSTEVLFSDDNSLVLHIKNDIFGNAEGTLLMRLLFNEQDLLQQLDLSFSKVLMPWQISPFPLTQSQSSSQSRVQQQPRQQQRQGVAQPVRQPVRQTQPVQTSQTVQQQPAVIEQPQEQVNVQQQPGVVRPVAGQQQQRVNTPLGQPTRRQGGQ